MSATVFLLIRYRRDDNVKNLSVWKTRELAAIEAQRVCQDYRVTVAIHALELLTEPFEATW